MLEGIKQQVLQANLDIVKHGLVLLTWGNVSAFDEQTGYVVIKPSGISYDQMHAEDMVVVDLDGRRVEGKLNPSSDTPTHVELYKAFSGVKAVVHTHSKWATSWAQANRGIPALGTTHADNFFGEIPCTRRLTEEEICGEYERDTGTVIIETFRRKNIDPLNIGAVIVANHGPFSWGSSCEKAVENAIVMERAAEMAYISVQLNTKADIQQPLLGKHFLRKHGKDAYYGQ